MSLARWMGELSRLLSRTPISLVSVRIRKGPAQGARWTLLPFSSSWRSGGDPDVLAGIALLSPARGKVCWDLGAHFGLYTLIMSRRVGTEGQVVAFEPDSVARLRLEHHVAVNGLDNVRVVAAAASDRAGTGDLLHHEGAGSSFSHFQYEDEPLRGDEPRESVMLVAPDELVRRGDIRAPDLVKVDVQGHGAKALSGSIESIRGKRPVIVFSNHSPWEYRGVRALLEPLGYRALDSRHREVGWDAVAGMDTFLLTCQVQGIADSEAKHA